MLRNRPSDSDHCQGTSQAHKHLSRHQQSFPSRDTLCATERTKGRIVGRVLFFIHFDYSPPPSSSLYNKRLRKDRERPVRVQLTAVLWSLLVVPAKQSVEPPSWPGRPGRVTYERLLLSSECRMRHIPSLCRCDIFQLNAHLPSLIAWHQDSASLSLSSPPLN